MNIVDVVENLFSSSITFRPIEKYHRVTKTFLSSFKRSHTHIIQKLLINTG